MRVPVRLRRLALAAALAASAGAALGDDSLRCDGGIVSLGDSKLDLLGKCGSPALVEERPVEFSQFSVLPGVGSAEQRSATTLEKWTYDFGPSRFVQIVSLELGRVVKVERGTYGYDANATSRDKAPKIPRARCDHLVPREGLTSFELLSRCGEPAMREVGLVTISSVVGGGRGGASVLSRTAPVEVWYFDFGPQVLVRRVTVEDGRVLRVETGGYGYSSP